MQLVEHDLEEYKAIYKSTYGADIQEEEAIIQAQKLLNLIKYSLSPETFDYGD